MLTLFFSSKEEEPETQTGRRRRRGRGRRRRKRRRRKKSGAWVMGQKRTKKEVFRGREGLGRDFGGSVARYCEKLKKNKPVSKMGNKAKVGKT